MAKLVDVFDPDSGFDFQRRQVPLKVDDLHLVLQMSPKCVECEKLSGVKQKDLDSFSNKFRSLSKDEISGALLVTKKDIMSILSHMVPCVGCRHGVERLFVQLQKSRHPALEPLLITPRGELSVHPDFLLDPRSLFSLFHIHGSRLHSLVESTIKSKKNKRCNLHSLETNKAKALGCWLETWDALSDGCREKILRVEADHLLVTAESYLKKHNFCTDCRAKVLLAYRILVEEHDHKTESDYCAALYANLWYCNKRHVHVRNDTEYIGHLFEKAEPHILGMKLERHAKTVDIGQEEMLTILGANIFDRLHNVAQKMKIEEQTWMLLFYLGAHALCRSYEVALEEKQGTTKLELLCEELEQNERRKEEKKEMKKLKKRQKKAKNNNNNNNIHHHHHHSEGNNCSKSKSNSLEDIDDVSCNHSPVHAKSEGKTSGDSDSLEIHSHSNASSNEKIFHTHEPSDRDDHHFHANSTTQTARPDCSPDIPVVTDTAETRDNLDCGQSHIQHKHNGKANSDGSLEEEIGHHPLLVDGCKHNCDDDGRNKDGFGKFSECIEDLESNGKEWDLDPFISGEQPSLQNLLQEFGSEDGSDDESCGISQEEIRAFKARQKEVESERQMLRQELRQKFEELHVSNHTNCKCDRSKFGIVNQCRC